MKKLVVLKPFGMIKAGESFDYLCEGIEFIDGCDIRTLEKLGYVKWQEEEDELVKVLEMADREWMETPRATPSKKIYEAKAVRKFFREKISKVPSYNYCFPTYDIIELFEERE